MSKHYSPHIESTACIPLIGLITLFVFSSLSVPSRLHPSKLAKLANPGLPGAQISESLAKLPLSFEENLGQTDKSVRFIARGNGYQLYLTQNEAVMQLLGSKPARSTVTIKMVGSKPDAEVEGQDPISGKSNYFIGGNPRDWKTDVPNYSRVRYREIYPGIDLVYYGNQKNLEYDFVVSPGVDPKQIKLSFENANRISIDEGGDLLVAVESEQLQMRSPYVYQEIDGTRHRIEGKFQIDRQKQVAFQIGDYNPDYQLIIDPVVEYSTYLGGSGADVGYGIAVDQRGNIYVTGQTSSLNFPVKNPYDSALDGASDAFVVKLNPANSTLVFATYIGGRNPGDRGWAIAVDRAGNVYFTGETTSLNFPVVNAAQPTFRGNGDAFVAKLSIDGNVLIYSTYLGGSFFDAAYSLALDRFDNAYITGRTNSANFPVSNALQPQIRGQRDAFVSRLNADGGIVFSTYLGGAPATSGGRDEETGFGIALDPLQNIYVTGFTTSPNFPMVNAYQSKFGGVEDAFVTKLNSSANTILYSTYLGGERVDDGRAIAVDSFGNAYITGLTVSSDFPQVNRLQPAYNGGIDGFIAKLNPLGNSLIYSTYFGGTGAENNGLISDNIPGCAIAVDNMGNVFVTGKTESQNFPVVNAIKPTLNGNSDIYLSKIDPSGTSFIYSTLLGTNFAGDNGYEEQGLAIAVDSSGKAYITGQVLTSGYLTLLPYQNNYGGGLSDAFVTKVSAPDITPISVASAASFRGAAFAPESMVSIFGVNLAGGTEIGSGFPLPIAMLGTSVIVRDRDGIERPAPLFHVSPNQINFLMPPDTPNGKATITVTNGTNLNLSAAVWVNDVAPALFSADASGQGVPSALLLRIKDNGALSFEPVATINAQGQFVPLPIDLGPETDKVFLILFGSGLRNRSSLSSVNVQISGINVPVTYAGPQGSYMGQDQINLQLPRSLAGRGAATLAVTVEGMIANPLSLSIR